MRSRHGGVSESGSTGNTLPETRTYTTSIGVSIFFPFLVFEKRLLCAVLVAAVARGRNS